MLEKGKIVESGKHFDLLAKNEKYYAMAVRQGGNQGSAVWDFVWGIGQRFPQMRSKNAI